MKKGALDQRAALVTGDGRGIGRAIALALAEEGADVAVAARSTAELDKVCGEIDQLGRRACAATYDAKHGLIGLMRAMVHQIPPSITANTLCPGWTETRLANDYFENAALAMGTEPASLRAAAEAENVQNRLVQPEELGPMAVVIASEIGGRAITGQVISVDGGYKV